MTQQGCAHAWRAREWRDSFFRRMGLEQSAREEKKSGRKKPAWEKFDKSSTGAGLGLRLAEKHDKEIKKVAGRDALSSQD